MESVYNTVGCSNCEFCCAYSYAGNPYCADQSECNGPHGTPLALAITISIVCVIVFGIFLVLCYKFGKDRTFEVFEEDNIEEKKQLELVKNFKINNQITDFNIEDAYGLPSSERRFGPKIK